MKIKTQNNYLIILFLIFFLQFIFASCDKNENQDTLFLNVSVSDLRPLSVTIKCGMESIGAWSIQEKGVCWSTHENPTIDDNKTIAGRDTGDFTCFLSLLPNTKYYVKAYYSHKGGIVYDIYNNSFTTPNHAEITFGAAPLIYNTISDSEGNSYKTIQIGTQTWMAENLKSKKFRNGKDITNITDNSLWKSQSSSGLSDFLNLSINSDTYGKLYNWETVNSSDSLCPSGWHVPTDNDWKILETQIGLNMANIDNTGERGKETAKYLQENVISTDKKHWILDVGAKNTTGFTAIPGGFRDINGNFNRIEKTAYWWTISESDAESAWSRSITSGSINRSSVNKKYGFSVRCIMN